MNKPKLRYFRHESKGLFCLWPECPGRTSDRNFGHIVRHGYYYRSSDRIWVTRFKCKTCRHTFSRATLHPCLMQKKRHMNFPLWHQLCSNVSLTRAARLLRLNRKTVSRKQRFLGAQAVLLQRQWLSEYTKQGTAPVRLVQFDEMETFEHTKRKPVSIPLVVEEGTRYLLAVEACKMASKTPLTARKKQDGPWRSERFGTLRRVLKELKPHVLPEAQFSSDSQPQYPSVLQKVFPQAKHLKYPSRRAAPIGQGELKVGAHDPLFSLNHTAAMFRANVSRLIRKTWCTTKNIDRLRDHLAMYAVWHNQMIRESRNPRGTAIAAAS